MTALLLLALKSLLVAGVGLLLLRATGRRSAAERSALAHLALLMLVLVPLSSLVLPSVDLPMPDALRARLVADPVTPDPVTAVDSRQSTAIESAQLRSATPTASSGATVLAPRIDWAPYAYAVPVVALLLVMLVALLRLVALRARSEVLVEPVWLSALAHAQRRMGFKSGTALLVSDALPSPISWGWARPVIVLSREAVASPREAEAIIAHELAHVISLDWAKLMLARIATALFWFNPLVWALAREAHQLREEAADDAVLAAAIPGPDYAQLLVGVARHESRGLLLGAHGVAPGPGSLKRRVGRVLDATLVRGPAGRSWLAGFGFGMLVMAAPLAALTIAPKVKVATATTRKPTAAYSPVRARITVADESGRMVLSSPSGATVTVAPPDVTGRRAVTMRSPSGAVVHYADAAAAGVQVPEPPVPPRHRHGDDALDQLMAMKAVGATPAYTAAIERAAPWLAPISSDDIVSMKAVGVTPSLIGDLVAAGFGHPSADTIVSASAVGLEGSYARAMAAAGFRGSVDRLIEARAVGLTPADMTRHRRFGGASAKGAATAAADRDGGSPP